MTIKGADAVLQALEQVGVEVIFGIPGGASMPIYDPLVDRSPIRHVLCRHEQGAGHAAEGYAWATGKVGVCMATSGPGATNLVTPLADAKMDSVPIVAITGQVPTPVVGNDAFQEADITGITMPVTKHNFLVKDAPDTVRTVREAVPDHVVISTHCHNDHGLAVANSLAGIVNGARQVEVAVNGIGERAGNCSLEEVAMIVRTHREALGVPGLPVAQVTLCRDKAAMKDAWRAAGIPCAEPSFGSVTSTWASLPCAGAFSSREVQTS